MIITISGYDGIGKSTSVELLRKRICDEYNLKGASVLEINGDREIYNTEEEYDKVCKEASRYDVVTTRFFLRGTEMQTLQNSVMFNGVEIFDNTELIKKTAEMTKEEAIKLYNSFVKQLHENNKIVIYDRYWFDEIAYRSLYSWDKESIEKMYEGYEYPEIRIFMHGDMELIRERNKDRIDIQTALFKSEKKMLELYDNMEYIREKFEMKSIEVKDKSREEITEELFELIKKDIEKVIVQRAQLRIVN